MYQQTANEHFLGDDNSDDVKTKTVSIELWRQDELDLIIFDKGTDYNALLDICKKIAHYSVKSNHPRHLSFFYSGFDAAGTAGAWLTDALNANM